MRQGSNHARLLASAPLAGASILFVGAEPNCEEIIGKTLKRGDDWSDSYMKTCGELVQLDVLTNTGVETYQVGKAE